METFTIKTPKGKRKIGGDNPCFIVAEISANHKQNFNNAVKIIKEANRAGADAIKLQTYTPDTLTLDSKLKWFYIGGKDNPNMWKGKTFYELYKKAYTPWDWQPKLKKIAEDLGMTLFSTPFDDTAVDFLEKMKVPMYKIASYEATDILLLKKIAKTKKPVIMSVGFATEDEIRLSVKILRDNGTKNLAILHCTTSYNDSPNSEFTNLRTMLDIKDRYKVICGFSDNMGGIEVPALAAAMGASIIEKHIVVKHGNALDDKFSLDGKQFKKMVDKIRWQEKAIGKINYGCQTKQEKYNRQFRRSLFVVEDVKKGEVFTKKNVRSIRPAYGLETKFFDDVLGKTASKDIKRGTPLNHMLIKN